ncbi:MAG: hypothetical protein ABI169_16810, partial [Chitinophagaceae bacterium]
PFELSSVLFLSAMIGAIIIGKKDDAPHREVTSGEQTDGMDNIVKNDAPLINPAVGNARTALPEHDHYQSHN